MIPRYLDSNALNWFIPNPEWYVQPRALLNKVDLVLCRTREVEKIFQELDKNTYYLGFTTPDHANSEIVKSYECFLHVSGKSRQKGSGPIIETWAKNPSFPDLIIVKTSKLLFQELPNLVWYHWMETEALRHLQNSFGIHLCLSETEGFGHYLMEAMSMGAVVITTDAPPMNEFIKDPRCLAPYCRLRRFPRS